MSGALRLNGGTSGYSELRAPDAAGDQTFFFPTSGGTLLVAGSEDDPTGLWVRNGTTLSPTNNGDNLAGIGTIDAAGTVVVGNYNSGDASSGGVQIKSGGAITLNSQPGTAASVSIFHAYKTSAEGNLSSVFSVTSQGNVTADGIIQAGDNPSNGAQFGVKLTPTGGVIIAGTDGLTMYDDSGSGNATAIIYSDGGISSSKNIITGTYNNSDASGASGVRLTASGQLSVQRDGDVDNDTDSRIQLLHGTTEVFGVKLDGSITTDGNINLTDGADRTLSISPERIISYNSPTTPLGYYGLSFGQSDGTCSFSIKNPGSSAAYYQIDIAWYGGSTQTGPQFVSYAFLIRNGAAGPGGHLTRTFPEAGNSATGSETYNSATESFDLSFTSTGAAVPYSTGRCIRIF